MPDAPKFPKGLYYFSKYKFVQNKIILYTITTI